MLKKAKEVALKCMRIFKTTEKLSSHFRSKRNLLPSGYYDLRSCWSSRIGHGYHRHHQNFISSFQFETVNYPIERCSLCFRLRKYKIQIKFRFILNETTAFLKSMTDAASLISLLTSSWDFSRISLLRMILNVFQIRHITRDFWYVLQGNQCQLESHKNKTLP